MLIRTYHHHNCFSKYCNSKSKRLNKPSKKRKCIEDKKERKSTRLLDESRKNLDLFCCWCSRKDVTANLVPAGTYQATKLTTKSNHRKDLTAKRIEMATNSNQEPVLRLLSSGDVASNELYYHDKCYDTIRYQYIKFTKSKSDKNASMRDAECKHIALKKSYFI